MESTSSNNLKCSFLKYIGYHEVIVTDNYSKKQFMIYVDELQHVYIDNNEFVVFFRYSEPVCSIDLSVFSFNYKD